MSPKMLEVWPGTQTEERGCGRRGLLSQVAFAQDYRLQVSGCTARRDSQGYLGQVCK